ncbi:MAG: endonuclease III domain-containing protein [Planctomycetota bacterium]
MSGELMEVYEALKNAFGYQDWWPAEGPFEVMVGAILTQNTNWNNVETALDNLREQGMLEPRSLAAVEAENLQEAIRPAGYYRQKTGRLIRLARWVLDNWDGTEESFRNIAQRPVDELRAELLGINGIGPETADSILLYALGKPVFVVDTYTIRIFSRHELLEPRMPYREVQETITYQLPDDLDLYRDYHAQLVELGKKHCSKTSPSCEECPLRPLLGEPTLQTF